MRNVLLYFALKYSGDWDSIYKALDQKEKITDQELEIVEKMNIDFVTIIDDKYPKRLKRITKPPFILFYKGDLSLANKEAKTIAIIGSREPSQSAKDKTERIVSDLKGVVIVSGMAKGVDSFTHEAALKFKNPTIAVLGTAIDNPYPKNNQKLYAKIVKKGLVLSEYPKGAKSSKNNFKSRNRLISGLSQGVLVVEAKKKSGTMNTVSHALSQNKEVFALPSSDLVNSGTNALIKEGAILVENGNDILKEII